MLTASGVGVGWSLTEDSCVLVMFVPLASSLWLVFCLRLVRTRKGISWVISKTVGLLVASAWCHQGSVQDQ